MKTTNSLVVLLALVGSCYSQSPAAEAHRSNTQIIEFILDFQEKRLLDVAEAMPPEEYGFAPFAGDFKGVRTFAEQLKHIASDNYLLGAGILEEKPPNDPGVDERGADAVQTKDEIVAYLKDSFAYMHRAAAAIDDAKRPIPTPTISPWPEGTATRLGVAIEDGVHTWDHYGQLVEYLRMNGIVPPASRPAASRKAISQPLLTVNVALDYWITNTERQVVPAADAMPEEKYSFAPTGGEFSGVRTFAQQVKHLAANNYRVAAYIASQTPTPDEESETGPESVRSKPQIMDYLKGSFAALHRSLTLINSENLLQPLGLPYEQNTRLQLAVDAVAHSYDHYGQIIEYLRMNNIVPPASRR